MSSAAGEGTSDSRTPSVRKHSDIPFVVGLSVIAGTYVLLNLTADIISIVTNPRLLHPK